ncbi:MAG: SDR family oxidoreductase [Candidatus Promineifilaceae bacterium]
MVKLLSGKIAVVAGATRGAGRAIAVCLGAAGATVYCTGRSVRGSLASGAERQETIEESAELVTAAGGIGRWVQTDHTVESQVVALFERVREEAGRVDILVNDVWGGDALSQWGTPLAALDLGKGFTMLERAVHSHIITTRYALPLMEPNNSGLIIEITDGDQMGYRGALFYDLVKTSVMRLAYSYARELRHSNITSLAVTPGFLRSEAMLDMFGVTEANWRDAAKQDPHFIASETPTYLGRAIVALATDPAVRAKSGRTLATWSLAKEYGFTDADGTQPDWGSYYASIADSMGDTAFERIMFQS